LKDLQTLETLASQAGQTDHIAKVLMLYASYYFVTGDYPNSIDCAKQAEVHSAYIAKTEAGIYSQLVWSLALLRLGRSDEAMHRAQTALEHARTANNRKEEARVLTSMGLIALEQKEPAHAQKYLVEGLEIARELKDLGLQARALNNLAKSEETVNRNYAIAHQYYEQSYKIAREIGDRNAESFTLVNLGFAAGMQGDFVAARSYHEQSLSVASEIGNKYHEMLTLINLSAVVGLQKDAVVAFQYAHQAAELARRISERDGEAWAMLYLGHACLLLNELKQAQVAYSKSVEIRHELGQPSLAMEPIAGLIETFLQANDLDSAFREAEKILRFLDRGLTLDGTEEPLRVYYACYVLLKKKQDPRSKKILQAAMRLLEAQVSKFRDEAARKRYIENIPWRRAIWDAGQAYAH
ncbi:MAG TPA: tetratricopeptide repeat protein, partial [Anaerolineales bacterium]|nr:tetratricopeptide repeat protein [Anaerolineales bacterium]